MILRTVRLSDISWHLRYFSWSCISHPLPPSRRQRECLSGVVKDQTGAVLPGVSVEVRNTGTDSARTAITDDVGRWTVPALPVGTYQVSFELPSFKKLTKDGVTLKLP